MTPHKHHIKTGTTSFNYLLFDSVWDFNAFVDQEIKQLSYHNANVWKEINRSTKSQIESGTDWYGTPAPKNISGLNEHRFFLGMELLRELKPKIKDRLARYMEYLDHEVMPKPKIAYNDRGLGIFSFDRAAMGLYNSGKINIRTPLDRTMAQLNIELGRDNINTSVKNVFAYFENKDTSYPMLRLYIMAGANAHIKGNELLYVGLACSELVEFMEQRGVAVEVNVLIGSSHNSQVSIASIRVKRFQDKADINQLLLMSSDPRYFRYRGFKALIALANSFGLNIPGSLGRLEENMGREFVNHLKTDGFVFEQSYALDTAAKEVTRIIETYHQNSRNATDHV